MMFELLAGWQEVLVTVRHTALAGHHRGDSKEIDS